MPRKPKAPAPVAAPERRYISVNTGRPWHILGTREPDALWSVCGTKLPISALYPGWPKEVDRPTLYRQYPASLVCRQCSDNAPLT